MRAKPQHLQIWNPASWGAGRIFIALCYVVPRAVLGAPPSLSHPQHLDLRPPPIHGETLLPSIARPSHPIDLQAYDEDTHSPAARIGPARVMSRPAAMINKFRREGLPLARLWENHSAMLSLGLNAKGKPGLWLVQKTH